MCGAGNVTVPHSFGALPLFPRTNHLLVMKSTYTLAAMFFIATVCGVSQAQPERSLRVQSIILDDHAGHSITITPPIGLVSTNYTLHLPDHPDTLLTRLELCQNALAAACGGTGISHFSAGDILYADTDSTLAVLSTVGALNGRMLSLQADSNGVLLPKWIAAGGVATVSGTDSEITVSSTTGDVVVGLANVNTITPGSYSMPDITVDSKGRITAVSSSTAAGGGIYCGETTSKLSNGAGTNYFFPMGPSAGNGTTNQVGVSKTICPRTGTLINFFVLLSDPVNAPGSRVFRIIDETSGDTLSAVITGGSSEGNSAPTEHFHTTAGDVIHVEQTGTGGGLGTPIATWAFEIQCRRLRSEVLASFSM
jgi:hypothetical protein